MIRAIGPYELVRRLGRGGMAEVHLAIAHGASGFERKVAIKLLAPELAGDHDLERALIHEATLGGRLHHRNLVAVLGLGVAIAEARASRPRVTPAEFGAWVAQR